MKCRWTDTLRRLLGVGGATLAHRRPTILDGNCEPGSDQGSTACSVINEEKLKRSWFYFLKKTAMYHTNKNEV